MTVIVQATETHDEVTGFEYDEKLDDPEIFLDACYTEMPVDLDANLWVLISTDGEVHEIDLTDDDDDDYDYDPTNSL